MKLYLPLSYVALLSIGIAPPVMAKSLEPITEIPRLNEIERPLTSAKFLVQQPQPTEAGDPKVVQVIGVRLNATANGIEVILETADGKQPQVSSTSSSDKTFVADLSNAQLRLPQGDRFRAENPTTDIALVTVQQQSANSIRVTVVGLTSEAIAKVQPSNNGLIFSLNTTSDSTAQRPPEKPGQPQTPSEEAQPTPKPTQPATPGEGKPATPVEEEIEITVTAEKTPENVQDVPIGITVLTERELEDAQVDTLQDVSKNTPNFFVLAAPSREFSLYSIRGLGNSNSVNRDAVGFYVDDVPYDYGAFLDFDLPDLERVEVLRGPQSTLYGRNSQAGVVNIISRRPTNTPEGRAAASYGNYDSLNLQLSLSDALVPDKLSYRLSGSYARRDGFYENTFLDKVVGDQSSGAGRAQLLWTPSPEWQISFVGSYNGYDTDSSYIIVPLSQSDPYKTTSDFPGFSRLDANTQSVKVAYQNPGFQFTSVTARRYSNQSRSGEADFTSADLVRISSRYKSTTWSQEVRLQSPQGSDRFRWLIGGYFESRQFNDLGSGLEVSAAGAALFRFPAAGANLNRAELNQTSYAGFGQVDYKPIEPLTLTAGLRYESSTSRLDRRLTFETASGSLPLGTTFNDVEQSDSQVIPRFALEYRFRPNLMVYGSVTRGYKPSGLNFRTDSASDLRFQAETSWNYELGLKSSWFNDRLIANVAVFTNEVDNYQVSVFDPTLTNSSVFNAEVRIRGIELEMRARPVQGLDLIAGFGYTDAKFTNYPNPGGGQSFNGNRLSISPEYTLNLAAQYRSPGGLFARLELQGVGTYYLNNDNRFAQDPFVLVNARLGYEGKNYGIYLFANNVFDTYYLTNGFNLRGEDLVSYGDRATYGVQVKVNF